MITPEQERVMFQRLQQDSTGSFAHGTLEVVAGAPLARDDELVRETAKRLIDEVVELGLDAGLSANEILGAITDGLHNEARKTNGKLYPSQLGYGKPDRDNLLVEITDVDICLDTLRFVAGIPSKAIDEHRTLKLELNRRRAHAGEYMLVGKRAYKKVART